MPVSDDPAVSGARPQDPGNPGYLGGPVPSGSGGMLPGGTEQGSINQGSPDPWTTERFPDWLCNNDAWGDFWRIPNPIDWFNQNFGPGSPFSNDVNNMLNPRITPNTTKN